MTKKQKSIKLANVLEETAKKLRLSDIGERLWDADEPTLQNVLAHLHILLKKAEELESGTSSSIKRPKAKKEIVKEVSDEWPDIIFPK